MNPAARASCTFAALVVALVAAMTAAAGLSLAQSTPSSQGAVSMTGHKYIGMWVTPDGHIRQELLPNGRYDEARGRRKSAYQGRYEIRGDRIDYWDDTGFTADGTFVSDDELHHGGMIFRRERQDQTRGDAR
jgi:hypothetical protein